MKLWWRMIKNTWESWVLYSRTLLLSGMECSFFTRCTYHSMDTQSWAYFGFGSWHLYHASLWSSTLFSLRWLPIIQIVVNLNGRQSRFLHATQLSIIGTHDHTSGNNRPFWMHTFVMILHLKVVGSLSILCILSVAMRGALRCWTLSSLWCLMPSSNGTFSFNLGLFSTKLMEAVLWNSSICISEIYFCKSRLHHILKNPIFF